MTQYFALAVAIISIVGTIVTASMFFGRLKWESHRHDEDIKKHALDMNKLGEKVSKIREQFVLEQREILAKIDNVEKQMIEMSVTLDHVRDVLNKVEERLIGNGT